MDESILHPSFGACVHHQCTINRGEIEAPQAYLAAAHLPKPDDCQIFSAAQAPDANFLTISFELLHPWADAALAFAQGRLSEQAMQYVPIRDYLCEIGSAIQHLPPNIPWR
jgi:hypothetical protein